MTVDGTHPIDFEINDTTAVNRFSSYLDLRTEIDKERNSTTKYMNLILPFRIINFFCLANTRLRIPNGNQKGTIQGNWQHRIHTTQDENKQNKNTTQYVLDTTLRKQTQIT